MIENMENQVADVLQQERSWWDYVLVVLLNKKNSYFTLKFLMFNTCREERAIRKAEMEATKVFNPSPIRLLACWSCQRYSVLHSP